MNISGLSQMPFQVQASKNKGGGESFTSTDIQADQAASPAYTADQLKTGFFGDSRTTLQSALASGHVVNTLSYLTASDIDLVQKTTGITIKDGNYYDKDGNEVNDLGTPAETAAFQLANSLSEMRVTGGPEGDSSLQSGTTITAKDLQAYLDDYAKADAADSQVFKPDADVIEKAESVLTAEAGS